MSITRCRLRVRRTHTYYIICFVFCIYNIRVSASKYNITSEIRSYFFFTPFPRCKRPLRSVPAAKTRTFFFLLRRNRRIFFFNLISTLQIDVYLYIIIRVYCIYILHATHTRVVEVGFFSSIDSFFVAYFSSRHSHVSWPPTIFLRGCHLVCADDKCTACARARACLPGTPL